MVSYLLYEKGIFSGGNGIFDGGNVFSSGRNGIFPGGNENFPGGNGDISGGKGDITSKELEEILLLGHLSEKSGTFVQKTRDICPDIFGTFADKRGTTLGHIPDMIFQKAWFCP